MRYLLITFFSLCSLFAHADEVLMSNPNAVLETASSNTFARINNERAQLNAQPDYIKQVISEELIPYFDYKYAAYKVMGAHLKKTTKAQRSEFVSVFQDYLINAYGHILLEYDQQKLEIVHNNKYKDKKIVSVPVKVIAKDGQVTQIAFKLRKNKKTGEWRVFDVIAEGISMLNTKQSELNDIIHKKGVDHVIELLKNKNSEL